MWGGRPDVLAGRNGGSKAAYDAVRWGPPRVEPENDGLCEACGRSDAELYRFVSADLSYLSCVGDRDGP